MATTQLSLIATPGKRHSFLAKTESTSSEHTGLFTKLSISGIPGKRHSFLAKDAASIISGPHTGLFTTLSTLALPGQKHSFLDKTEAEEILAPVSVAPVSTPTGGSGITITPELKFKVDNRKRILQEDNELMELVAQIVTSGILK